MSTLLTQMRPAPSEIIDRREGPRKYQPDFPLNRYISIPSESERRDPKPRPFKMRVEGSAPRATFYTTPHGPLSNDLMDQFARHYQWKTTSQRDYVRHHPPIPPPPGTGKPPSFEPRSDMVRSTWAGRRAAGGPFEYQQVGAKGGQLPEDKAWPMVSKQYHPFPNNTVDGPAKQFREVRHNWGGRTPEETDKVRSHIRDLVKDQRLNPQFVKPLPGYRGLQDEVRLSEDLQRPPDRNLPNMHTEYISQYNRGIPRTEYRKPKYGQEHPLSNSIVLQRPFNTFNSAQHPHFMEYLPMPYNIHPKPIDVRLIS